MIDLFVAAAAAAAAAVAAAIVHTCIAALMTMVYSQFGSQ